MRSFQPKTIQEVVDRLGYLIAADGVYDARGEAELILRERLGLAT